MKVEMQNFGVYAYARETLAAGRQNDIVASFIEEVMLRVDWETKRPRFVLVGKGKITKTYKDSRLLIQIIFPNEDETRSFRLPATSVRSLMRWLF